MKIDTVDTLPKRIRKNLERFGTTPVFHVKDEYKDFQSITYNEFWQKAEALGVGFLSLGIKRGDRVGIISDNRYEWLVIDFALLGIGAADVPRGSDSTEDEIAYILGHAGCSVTVAENVDQLNKILAKIETLPKLKTVILINSTGIEKFTSKKVSIESFSNIIEDGKKSLIQSPGMFDEEVDKGKADDLATLIYTSGTTGEPKGVMLTQRSFLFQIDNIYDYLNLQPEDIFISVLPVWHSFERAVLYIVVERGASIAYSKPIGKILLEDMQKIRPTWMTAVPRIWEGIRSAVYQNMSTQSEIKKGLFHFFVGIGEVHSRFWKMFSGLLPQFTPRTRFFDIAISTIPLVVLTPFKLLGDLLVFKKLKARLGGRFQVGVSGGGALPSHVDRFYQAAGISVLEGYGLTETGPILAVRKEQAPVTGTVGPLFPTVEYKVVNDQGNEVGPNNKGVLHVKSPQVMLGYFNSPKETEKVLQNGWLNTGDLVVFTHGREFKIIGRAKETIVLLGGENIEPTPIEEALTKSDYIDNVMIVGQDQKFLGALITTSQEMVEKFAATESLSYMSFEELLEDPDIQEKINLEIQGLVNAKTGFKPFERVFRFKLLPKPFEVGIELTRSLKVRRQVVNEMYEKEIAALFTRN